MDQYSEKWRERRKLFVRYFHAPLSSEGMIGSVHVPEACEFVNRLLLELNDTPGEVQALTRQCVWLFYTLILKQSADRCT